MASLLVEAYEQERSIFLFGNGGSAALASHFACDLGKGAANGSKKRFRVMALTDNVPLMTAWANDSKYEDIFAEQLANFARPGDIAFAISGSGNSPNVLLALRSAKAIGSTTVGLGGFAQLLGPTGGFLMAYPFVAFLAGAIYERGAKSFFRATVAGIAGETLLFAGGLSWLYLATHSLARAAYLGLYWFVAAEVMKVMFAAAIAKRWRRQ